MVRVVAKIIEHTLFAKKKKSFLRKDELMMLYFGLMPFVYAIDTEKPLLESDTNFGAIFSLVLTQKKFRSLNTQWTKLEAIGSLFTPIFRFHQIDLRRTMRVDKLQLFD